MPRHLLAKPSSMKSLTSRKAAKSDEKQDPSPWWVKLRRFTAPRCVCQLTRRPPWVSHAVRQVRSAYCPTRTSAERLGERKRPQRRSRHCTSPGLSSAWPRPRQWGARQELRGAKPQTFSIPLSSNPGNPSKRGIFNSNSDDLPVSPRPWRVRL